MNETKETELLVDRKDQALMPLVEAVELSNTSKEKRGDRKSVTLSDSISSDGAAVRTTAAQTHNKLQMALRH